MNEILQNLIKEYQAPDDARQLINLHPPLILAGPTGAGKGTLAMHLNQLGEHGPVVSDTTRRPRPHNNGLEVNGVHYWFLDEAEATKKVSDGAYIEVKAVHQTTMYGTSIASYDRVVKTGRTPLLEIDVQGIEDLMSDYPGLEAIFLLPPDFDTWQVRLDGRGDMDPQEKLRRFKTAQSEFAVLVSNPQFYPVLNTEVVDTARIIMSGEYKRPEYREASMKIAREIIERTTEFLAHHTSSN